MKRLFNLQKFAAPDNMTGKAQIQTKAREIDFVSSFSDSLQALLDIMGITRMIKKANGSALKKKTAAGVLQDGNVAEGGEIPLSQFTVEEETFDTITIEKWRKSTSIEAIAEHGYDNAVAMTDEEMLTLLRDDVLDRFYDFMATGTLKSSEATWQMAIAMSIGRVKDKFKKMRKNATGIAVFVNTLDVYKYVGSSNISIQTAFGMDYVKNFMGADYMFISSEIPEGTVEATALNNMVAYYVDPADSEFAKAGLEFTTDTETGFIGVHAEGNYTRMLSELYAIMGVRLFAEYIDAVAVITVDSTPTLGTLTVQSAAGTETGDTKITVTPAKEDASHLYKYKVATEETEVTYGQNVRGWTAWDGESDITAATGQTITVVECDASYQAQASGSASVTAKA